MSFWLWNFILRLFLINSLFNKNIRHFLWIVTKKNIFVVIKNTYISHCGEYIVSYINTIVNIIDNIETIYRDFLLVKKLSVITFNIRPPSRGIIGNKLKNSSYLLTILDCIKAL